ncbi:hypothetical protein VN24_06865 [Paenibacillus beijingensis]|uniref:Uncharacterized protein n=1 Tax=Paenibacillus beijingensis TaxID=1126833 RepID=A0A0D5NGF8_9BACL|nr:hypothetical protein VN24_06865 [Paenibacillus beijingensis]
MHDGAQHAPWFQSVELGNDADGQNLAATIFLLLRSRPFTPKKKSEAARLNLEKRQRSPLWTDCYPEGVNSRQSGHKRDRRINLDAQ